MKQYFNIILFFLDFMHAGLVICAETAPANAHIKAPNPEINNLITRSHQNNINSLSVKHEREFI